MNRQEHMEWCKKRALEYLDNGDIANAYASMCHDLGLHPETTNHTGIGLGMSFMIKGQLSTVSEMRKFIEGFG